MYESPQNQLCLPMLMWKSSEGETRRRQVDFENLLLTIKREARVHPGGRAARKKACSVFLFVFFSAQSWSLSPLRSVSRCGRRQVVFSSEYVDGKGGAERRQVGWSVTASHWCTLSYVGINHDSEMTYFLTPQTNSTFNRSQGLCQTAFSPCSLSKSCI